MTAPPSTDDHIAEHVPWDQMTLHPRPDRKRIFYLAAAAVFVVVVGIVVTQQFRPTGSEFIPVVSASTATPLVTTATPQVAVPAPAVPAVLSEEDLMAIDSGEIERSVVARAEWASLEFFTLDPGDGWASRVSTAFGVEVDETSQPVGPQPEAVSYVEWVRAASVDKSQSGEYLVTVMMRRIVAIDGVSYDRLPLEWVAVPIAFDDQGAPSVTGWPYPTTAILVPSSGLLSEADWFVDEQGVSWPSSS